MRNLERFPMTYDRAKQIVLEILPNGNPVVGDYNFGYSTAVAWTYPDGRRDAVFLVKFGVKKHPTKVVHAVYTTEYGLKEFIKERMANNDRKKVNR